MDDAQRIERLCTSLRLSGSLGETGAAVIEQQQQEIARLRVDAARYRFIRDRSEARNIPITIIRCGAEPLDIEIDAALAATAPMRAEKEDGRG